MESKFELATELIIILFGMLGFSEPNSKINIQEEILSVPGYQVMRTYTANVKEDGYEVFYGKGDRRILMMRVGGGEAENSFVISDFVDSENSSDRVSIRAEIDLPKLMPTVDFTKFKEGGEVNMGEDEVFKIDRKDGCLVLTSPNGKKFAFSVLSE